jgi:hypothetical protein
MSGEARETDAKQGAKGDGAIRARHLLSAPFEAEAAVVSPLAFASFLPRRPRRSHGKSKTVFFDVKSHSPDARACTER